MPLLRAALAVVQGCEFSASEAGDLVPCTVIADRIGASDQTYYPQAEQSTTLSPLPQVSKLLAAWNFQQHSGPVLESLSIVRSCTLLRVCCAAAGRPRELPASQTW